MLTVSEIKMGNSIKKYVDNDNSDIQMSQNLQNDSRSVNDVDKMSTYTGSVCSSVYSASRNWSRNFTRQNKIYKEYRESRTRWPVSHIESLFLPEFKMNKDFLENDVEVLETISKGAYGVVHKVMDKHSGRLYAMKVLQKSQIIQDNCVSQVKEEVRIHSVCGHHPFIASCPYFWQMRAQVFIFTEFVSGGELFSLISKCGPFPEEVVRLYVAELAIVIDFLHNAGVIYRDLKSENILLDEHGHIRLIDFGLSKWLSIGKKTGTICGTFQYMAPEILKSEPYSHAVDWWSLGVLVCCLLTNEFPVNAENGIILPAADMSLPSRDLLLRLLQYDPTKRLRSLHTLKTIAFFKNYDFDGVISKKVKELCALHALNNLFQKEDAFLKEELDAICYSLTPKTWLNPHKSSLGLGNYDVNIIIAALQNKGYTAVWFDKRKDPSCLRLEKIFGFILNIPNDYHIGYIRLPFQRRHWIAVRNIKGYYYNLDSKIKEPFYIGQEPDLISFLRDILKSNENQLFVVVSADETEWKTESEDHEKSPTTDSRQVG